MPTQIRQVCPSHRNPKIKFSRVLGQLPNFNPHIYLNNLVFLTTRQLHPITKLAPFCSWTFPKVKKKYRSTIYEQQNPVS